MASVTKRAPKAYLTKAWELFIYSVTYCRIKREKEMYVDLKFKKLELR